MGLLRRRERLHGFGRAVSGESVVIRARGAGDIVEAFRAARDEGLTVALRGGGRSYGDASLNPGQMVLDLTGMNRVLDLDSAGGVVHAEAGATIGDLWRHAIDRGFWPPVVPGTMFVTLGGAAAMNVHGKNNVHAGPFGEHVVEFELLLPSGERVIVDRERHPRLFHAVIGGFGMLGCILSLKIRLRRVASGDLLVRPAARRRLPELMTELADRAAVADYAVGWVDAAGAARTGGRGLLHSAVYATDGASPPGQGQDLPARFLGVIPRRFMAPLLRPWVNDFGMRGLNALRYAAGSRRARRGRDHRQSLAAFSFLLDYIPGWERAYGPGGLIQHQSFVPADRAAGAFGELLGLAARRGLPPFLGVLKRHRKDAFLMSHGVDGFSLALDFRVTGRRREPLWSLAREMDRILLDCGGRFYFAKDATAEPATVLGAFGGDRVAAFAALRREVDPAGLLSTALWRRLLAPLI